MAAAQKRRACVDTSGDLTANGSLVASLSLRHCVPLSCARTIPAPFASYALRLRCLALPFPRPSSIHLDAVALAASRFRAFFPRPAPCSPAFTDTGLRSARRLLSLPPLRASASACLAARAAFLPVPSLPPTTSKRSTAEHLQCNKWGMRRRGEDGGRVGCEREEGGYGWAMEGTRGRRGDATFKDASWADTATERRVSASRRKGRLTRYDRPFVSRSPHKQVAPSVCRPLELGAQCSNCYPWADCEPVCVNDANGRVLVLVSALRRLYALSVPRASTLAIRSLHDIQPCLWRGEQEDTHRISRSGSLLLFLWST